MKLLNTILLITGGLFCLAALAGHTAAYAPAAVFLCAGTASSLNREEKGQRR